MNELDEEEFKKYKRFINYITKHNEEDQIEHIRWDNSAQKKTEYKLFKICNSICEKKMETLELHYWRLIRLYIISLAILISLKSKDNAHLYEIKSIINKIRYYLDYLGSNLDKPVKDRDIGLDSTDDIYELDENRKVAFDFLYHLPVEAEFNAKVKKKYKLMYILLDLNYSLINSELVDNKEDILSNLLELDIIEHSNILIQNLKQYLEFYDSNYKYLMVGGGDSDPFIKKITEYEANTEESFEGTDYAITTGLIMIPTGLIYTVAAKSVLGAGQGLIICLVGVLGLGYDCIRKNILDGSLFQKKCDKDNQDIE